MSVTSFRIATYNLQKCVGLDLRRRPDRSLQVINALGADLVVLQEADKRLPPRPAALPHDMPEEDGWHILPFGAPGGSLGWHGNAILLRKGLAGRVVDRLDLPGLEPRGAVVAEIDGLRVVGTHLGLRRRDRRRQLAHIRAALEAHAPMATAIIGDFNEWALATGLEPLAGLYTVHSPGKSFHAARPVAALDRVALSQGLELADAGVSQGPVAAIASDHLPVWASIRPDPGQVGASGDHRAGRSVLPGRRDAGSS